MVTLPNICNHYATAMQSSATAVHSKQRNSRRCSYKRCNRRRKPQRHTTASRCRSKCRFLKVPFRNSDGTKHSSTGATQVEHQCKASSMATPMQTQVQARCKHKRNTSANAMATTCRDMQTRIHPMQTQVQTQVQPQRQSADASASASIGAMHEQAARVPQRFPITEFSVLP